MSPVTQGSETVADTRREQDGTRFSGVYFFIVILMWLMMVIPVLPLPKSDMSGVSPEVLGQWQAGYLITVLVFIGLVMMRSLINMNSRINAFTDSMVFGDTASGSGLANSDGRVSHMVVMTVYREPLSIIQITLESLACQTIAHQLIVVIGFEEKSPAIASTRDAIRTKFGGQFKRIIFLVHPYGVPGETSGKCSNLNYAARQAEAILRKSPEFRPDETTITTCDADNLFHERYFEWLGQRFLENPKRHSVLWQAPLLYNWGLDHAPWFVYITGVYRSALITGVVAAWGLNGMSAFSLSLERYRQSGYTSPSFQMEDILSVIRWSINAGKMISIESLETPIICGPTSGRTLLERFDQWQRQIGRWAIGAAEVFAYFLKHSDGLPLVTRTRWGIPFFLYYFVFQCAAPLMVIMSVARLLWSPEVWLFNIGGTAFEVSDVMLGWLLWTAFLMIGLFRQNAQWQQRLGIKERRSRFTCGLRWALAPITIALHAVVTFISLHRVSLTGKAACSHEPTVKDYLPTPVFRSSQSQP